MEHKTNEQKLEETVFFVEANSFETFCLWQKNHNKENQTWEQDMSGFGKTVGYINDESDKVVFVSFTFYIINGKRVCFYEATSRYVDHTMVDDLIKSFGKTYNGSIYCKTDAQNFHSCLHYIDDLNSLEA